MHPGFFVRRARAHRRSIRPPRLRPGSAGALGAAILSAVVVGCFDADDRGAAPSDPSRRADAVASGGAPDGASRPAPDAAREFDRVDWGGGDVDRGRALFALHCATCHGGDGRGEGPAAIALNPKPRDLTEGTYYIDANENDETGESIDLARVILLGPAAFGGSEAMQGWSETLSVDEVRDVVAFVESLAKRRE
jgi:mono/diheme cytochrome c family protein